MDNTESLQRIFVVYDSLSKQPEYSEVSGAVQILKQMLSKSNLSNVYVSFNGGKDATVALFLTVFALRQLGQQIKLQCLYFQESNPFKQINQFMKQMESMLNLKIHALKSKKYQTELSNFSEKQQIDNVIMGSRKDDPGCGQLGIYAPSDTNKGYPSFMRINPIINWSYDYVWQFIQEFRIPYCKLYDEGYTSLGNRKNTRKNSALYDEKTKTYKKAYLAPKQVQRDCRITKK